MPVVDIIIGSLLLDNDIRVTLIELAMELGVLLDWLELLDSVDLERVLARLLEEGLGLRLELVDVLIQVLSVESGVFVVCLNHITVYCAAFIILQSKIFFRIKSADQIYLIISQFMLAPI